MNSGWLTSMWCRLSNARRDKTCDTADSLAANYSVALRDQRLLRRFVADPGNTFLVSFPRTGSHWLRMLMELYFERPLLTRSFYYPNNPDFLALHTHDMELTVCRRKVIYLYRDPVDTVYSQLRYHDESPDDSKAALKWADVYGRHLEKWLLEEQCTSRKTILRYEGLRADLVGEFEAVCTHFRTALDKTRLEEVASQISREIVRGKTTHDPKVIDTSDGYLSQRERFRENIGEMVMAQVISRRPGLAAWLEGANG